MIMTTIILSFIILAAMCSLSARMYWQYIICNLLRSSPLNSQWPNGESTSGKRQGRVLSHSLCSANPGLPLKSLYGVNIGLIIGLSTTRARSIGGESSFYDLTSFIHHYQKTYSNWNNSIYISCIPTEAVETPSSGQLDSSSSIVFGREGVGEGCLDPLFGRLPGGGDKRSKAEPIDNSFV